MTTTTNQPSRLLLITVPLFGLLLAILAVECLVRLLLSGSSGPGPGWSDRPKFYFASPKVPSMQGLPYELPKPEGRFRVAVVGDSFTFAPFMQFTDTFAFKLEQMLNVQAEGQERVQRAEVVNYGVPAYSTTHEVPIVAKAISDGADLIILQVTLNDPEVKAHRPTGIQENMFDKFAPSTPTGVSALLTKWWKTYGFVRTRLANSASHRFYIDYYNDLFENPKSWEPFSRSMASISKMAKEKNIQLVAVVFPLFGIPMNERYPFYPLHKKVDELLTTLKIPHTDVSVIYKGIPLERLQVIPGVDRHPNEIAHRMAAEEIYTWLEKGNFIPDHLVIREKFATRLGTAHQRRLEEK